MSPPGDHSAGKHPGKGGSGGLMPCPGSGASQGSQVTPVLWSRRQGSSEALPCPSHKRQEGPG